MANFDFTTFTEVDPNAHLTIVSASEISAAALNRSESAYIYKDSGVDYWDSDFVLVGEFRAATTAVNGSGMYLCGLANSLDALNLVSDNLSLHLYRVSATDYRVVVYERDSSAEYGTNVFPSGYNLTEGTSYYFKLWRDEAVGTYGTIYAAVYTDAARTAQIGDTATVTLHTSKKNYRYIYGASSRNAGAGTDFNGNVYNLTEQNIATIAFTEDDDVVAIVGELPNIATIAFTEDDDVVAIVGEVATTAIIAFTEDNDVVAIVASLDVPTATIAFTEDNDVVEIAGTIKNIATISFTEADDIVAIVGGVPATGYISFTEESDTISLLATISSVTEPFSVRVHHKTTGAAITGLTTVLLSIRQPATGYRWDFSDNSFKATPTTATLALDQVSAANQPGLYQSLVTTTSWSGWVEFEATYNDGTYTYSFPGEAYYTNGVRANGSWSVVEWAGVNALPTLLEIEASSVLAKQAKLDFMQKWVLNKLVESPSGDTVTLYDDDGEILKTWAWNNATKTRSKAT